MPLILCHRDSSRMTTFTICQYFYVTSSSCWRFSHLPRRRGALHDNRHTKQNAILFRSTKIFRFCLNFDVHHIIHRYRSTKSLIFLRSSDTMNYYLPPSTFVSNYTPQKQTDKNTNVDVFWCLFTHQWHCRHLNLNLKLTLTFPARRVISTHFHIDVQWLQCFCICSL